ncbi:hypothetical protein ACWGKU_30270 [Kitasatospora sp. NPDC054768]
MIAVASGTTTADQDFTSGQDLGADEQPGSDHQDVRRDRKRGIERGDGARIPRRDPPRPTRPGRRRFGQDTAGGGQLLLASFTGRERGFRVVQAALVSVSLVADTDVGIAAEQLASVVGEFSAFPFGEPKDMAMLRQIHTKLDAAQREFVTAARRSIHASDAKQVPWRLGGPPPWGEIEQIHQRDNDVGRVIP